MSISKDLLSAEKLKANIYPGANPDQPLTLNPHSTLRFIQCFPAILEYISNENLETFLNDDSGSKIPFKDNSNTTFNEEAECIKYARHITDDFRTKYFNTIENKFDTVCLSYYRQLGYSIPQSIIDEAPTPSLKEEYRKYNNDVLEQSIDPTFVENFEATHHYEYGVEVFLYPTHPQVVPLIEDILYIKYPHLHHAWNPTDITIETEFERNMHLINRMGKSLAYQEYIVKLRDANHKTHQNYEPQIKKLSNLFNILLHHIPDTTQALVNNHQFALAWKQFIQHCFEAPQDAHYAVLTQHHILLNHTYQDPNTFDSFWERQNQQMALLLFLTHHSHLSYFQCKHFTGIASDQDFYNHIKSLPGYANPHTSPITLPQFLEEKSRVNLLTLALRGSHLQSTINDFYRSDVFEHTMTNLLNRLQMADHNGPRRSAIPTLATSNHNDSCLVCNSLKYDLKLGHIKNHPRGTACHPKTIAYIRTHLTPDPKSAKPGSGKSHSSVLYTKSGETRNDHGQLIIQNELCPINACENCFRSSKSTGSNAIERGLNMTKHTTNNCPYKTQSTHQRHGASAPTTKSNMYHLRQPNPSSTVTNQPTSYQPFQAINRVPIHPQPHPQVHLTSIDPNTQYVPYYVQQAPPTEHLPSYHTSHMNALYGATTNLSQQSNPQNPYSQPQPTQPNPFDSIPEPYTISMDHLTGNKRPHHHD
jgi:hypothetical protein